MVLADLICPVRDIELFQYRPCTPEIIEGLKTGKFLCKSPCEFNDPFDTMMWWRSEGINHYFNDKGVSDVLSKFNIFRAEDVALNLSNCFRVSCFSEVCSSPTMWAHYADSCKGFCVGYEMHPSFEDEIDLGSGEGLGKYAISLFPVVYGEERMDMTQALAGEIEYVLAAERGSLKELDMSRYDILEPYKVSLIKSSVWAYEREWRIVIRGFRGNDQHDWILPSDNITRVILGPKIGAVDMAKISEALHEYASLVKRPIKLQKIKANWESARYELELEDWGEIPVPF